MQKIRIANFASLNSNILTWKDFSSQQHDPFIFTPFGSMVPSPSWRSLIESQVLVSVLLLTFRYSNLNKLSVDLVPSCINSSKMKLLLKLFVTRKPSICILWRYLMYKGSQRISNSFKFRERKSLIILLSSFPPFLEASETILKSIPFSHLAEKMSSLQSLLPFLKISASL